jgi:WS/DGAT/MGAT family acyltransferase
LHAERTLEWRESIDCKEDAVSERMSPVASIMWEMSQDSALRMTVGNLMVLDRAVTAQELTDRLTLAAGRATTLRRHADSSLAARTRMSWVDDEQFDAGAHVRAVGVAAPGDMRQVLDLVALVERSPFDPGISPWDATLIEGLDGGRVALYLRAHHCLTDGLHGVSIVRLLFDESWLSPDETDATDATEAVDAVPSNGDVHAIEHPTNGAKIIEASFGSSRRRPGTVSVTVDLAGAVHPIATTLTAARTAARRVDPLAFVVRGVQRSLDVASSVSRQVVVTGGRLSPLPASNSVSTRFEAFEVPDARTTALALGGSRNDLLVAAAARGLGLYHERLGMPCPEVRLASPARWRNGPEGSVVPARVEIPVASTHPGPLFGVVAERLARARQEPALRLTEVVASVIRHLPNRLLIPAVRAQVGSVDFVATTLPGLRGEHHLCGAVVESSFPFGPRLGSLMNVTGFGVGDRLDIGIGLDPTAIAEPDVLLECVQEAFQSFAGANGA